MSPAEKDALNKPLSESQLAALWSEAEMKKGRPWAEVFVHPDRLLSLIAMARASIESRELISSMELTLGNATSLAEFQAARIKELEDFNLKACDVVGKAEIRIATLEASGKWISVKQELPPNEDLVQTYGHTEHSLKCVGNEWRQEVARYLNNRFWTNSHIYVTHWQPLPAAPTDELLSPPPEVKEKI